MSFPSRKVVPISASGSGRNSPRSYKNMGHDDFSKHLEEEMNMFNDELNLDSNKFAPGPGAVSLGPTTGQGRDESKAAEGIVEEEEEPVQLVHQMRSAGKKKAEALERALRDLEGQLNTYKEKIKQVYSKLNDATKKNYELEEKIEALEDENREISEVMGGEPGEGETQNFMIAVGSHHNHSNGKPMKPKNTAAGSNLRGMLGSQEEEEVVNYDDFQEKEGWYKQFKKRLAYYKPFQKDIDRVQARFGKAVTSYFVFYRFVYLQIAILGLMACAFGVVHVIFQVALYGSSFTALMSGVGFLPGFMLHSSYHADEAINYTIFLLVGGVLLLTSIIQHLVMEDRHMKRVNASEKGNEAPYAKDVFCAWDMSGCATDKEAEVQKGSISNVFITKIEESRIAGLRDQRSRCDVAILYLRRFVGFILYLTVQGISFAAIGLVTIYTDDISNAVASSGFSSFSSIIAPLALNIINGVAPPLLKIITDLEAWDSGEMKVKILLGRMYLSNITNTLILAVSYLLLADPFLFAEYPSFRLLLETEESGEFSCRIDQCADAMFSLLLTNFFIQNATKLLIPWGKIQLQKFMKTSVIKAEPFEIEPSMINLFSYMSLVMITFPFAPLSLIFMPLAFFIKIKWEVWVMLRYNARPKKTWKAQNSGVIFTSFYLCTLMVIGLPAIFYFLSTNTFPKNCDIQDTYIDLCSDSVTNDVCTTDPDSKFYSSYGTTTYPETICSGACGPFVSYDSTLTPFKLAVYDIPVAKYIWIAMFDTSYATWALVTILWILRSLSVNVVRVANEHEGEEKKRVATKIAELEAANRKAEKALERMRREKANDDMMKMLSPTPRAI